MSRTIADFVRAGEQLLKSIQEGTLNDEQLVDRFNNWICWEGYLEGALCSEWGPGVPQPVFFPDIVRAMEVFYQACGGQTYDALVGQKPDSVFSPSEHQLIRKLITRIVEGLKLNSSIQFVVCWRSVGERAEELAFSSNYDWSSACREILDRMVFELEGTFNLVESPVSQSGARRMEG